MRIDFVQGVDAVAPGLSRAQEPLLQELCRRAELDVESVRLPLPSGKLLFPLVYGPLAWRLAARRPDVFHIANSWYAHLVPLLRRPTVVTCHDLIELDEIRAGERRVKPHRRFHAEAAMRGLRAAGIVVCDSEAVAARIRAEAPVLADRLRVIPLGVSARFSPGPPDSDRLQRLGVRPPYLLYVGSEQPRKNLASLVAGVARAQRRLPALQWVKVGRSQTEEGRRNLLQWVQEQRIDEALCLLDAVDDVDLVSLYRGAVATALMSWREGFGFPPLEAMACGCPAIVSNRDSLPEVVGTAGTVLDPPDVDGLADAIVRLATDDKLRQLYVEKGIARALLFRWDRVADRYAAVYAEAAAS